MVIEKFLVRPRDHMIQALEKLEKLDKLDPLVVVDHMIAHKKEHKEY